MSDTGIVGTEGTEGAKPEGTPGAGEQVETPTIESLQAKIDELTGHSRKWEDRAKENFEAKKALDEIRLAQMSDDEKRQATDEKRQAAAKEAEDRAAKAENALRRYQIAVEFGLTDEDTEALSAVSDETALRTLAERLSGRSQGGTRPNPAQGNRSGKPAPSSPADAFAEVMGELFN